MIFKLLTGSNYIKINILLKNIIKEHSVKYPQLNYISITFHVREKADIFMSHGCADKNYREIENCKYLHKFKLILVPGPWLKNKLINLGIPSYKIACVGWPKIDKLFKQNVKRELKGEKTILWAPTHNANHHFTAPKKFNISSYPKLNDHMALLNNIQGIKVIKSVHPKNRLNKMVTVDKLVKCDYVIADGGSTIYEAWALGKPVIFPDWIVKEKIMRISRGVSAEHFIYSNNIGYHANNINELVNFLKSDLTIESDVTEFMEEYMPRKFNGTSAKAVVDEIIKNIHLFK